MYGFFIISDSDILSEINTKRALNISNNFTHEKKNVDNNDIFVPESEKCLTSNKNSTRTLHYKELSSGKNEF